MTILFLLIFFLSNIIYDVVCLTFDFQLNTLSHDFTLDLVSQIYHKIPFQIPSINLCFGTPSTQCFDLVLCTPLLYTIIESHQSKYRLFKHQFNSFLSSTFDDNSSKTSLGFSIFENRDYYISGKICLDKISLPGKEPFKIELLFIFANKTQETPIINIDGYLGMQKYHYNNRASSPFLNFLFINEAISTQTFTINYNRQKGGTVEFGENKTNYYNTCDTNFEFLLVSGRDWYCNLSAILIGDLSLLGQDNIAVFDSVSSAVFAPYNMGLSILSYIQSTMNRDDNSINPQCNIQDNEKYLFLICNDKTKIDTIPPLHIIMDKAKIVIEWKHLMQLTEVNNQMVYVSLFVVEKDKNHLLRIGLPGFVDHSIHFDKDNLLIGILYLGNSNPMPNGSTDSNVYRQRYEKNFIIVLSIVLALGVIQLLFKKKTIK